MYFGVFCAYPNPNGASHSHKVRDRQARDRRRRPPSLPNQPTHSTDSRYARKNPELGFLHCMPDGGCIDSRSGHLNITFPYHLRDGALHLHHSILGSHVLHARTAESGRRSSDTVSAHPIRPSCCLSSSLSRHVRAAETDSILLLLTTAAQLATRTITANPQHHSSHF